MYYNPSYLINNNPLPTGIQFKIVTGGRSIGKTHAISKYLLKNMPDEQALGYITRYDKYNDITPWGQKFYPEAEAVKQIKGALLIDKVIKAYALPISTAFKTKNMNYDNPYITNCLLDECIAPAYVRNESINLITLLGTISRRTGKPFNPVTVWCTGNIDVMPFAPVFDMLGLSKDYIQTYNNPEKAVKKKGIVTIDNIEYGYIWEHTALESPAGVANVRPISPIAIMPEWCTDANIIWSFKAGKLAIAVWNNGYSLYLGTTKKAAKAGQLTPFEKASLRQFISWAENRGGVMYESIEVMNAAIGG